MYLLVFLDLMNFQEVRLIFVNKNSLQIFNLFNEKRNYNKM